MNTLIRRRIMMFQSESPTPPTPLPYDAEIEYLESTGTQFFDLGVKLTNESKIEIEYYSTDTKSNLFGSRNSANSKNITITIGSNVNGLVVDFNNSNYVNYRCTVNGFTSNKVKVCADKHLRVVYDIENNVTISQNASECNDIFICDTNAYLLSASGNMFYTKKCACKLYNFKLWEDNVLYLDFIPVRAGQVGYMYDRVSGQLFGNAGTGSFTLGNDKNL